MKEKVSKGSTAAKVVGGLEAVGETVEGIFGAVSEVFNLLIIVGFVALGFFTLYVGGMGHIWYALAFFALAGILFYLR